MEAQPSLANITDEIAHLKNEVASERTKRHAAETVREKAIGELLDSRRRLELLQAITMAANHAATIEGAMETALEKIAKYGGWAVGHVYLQKEEGASELVSLDGWYIKEPARFHEFHLATQSVPAQIGNGLAGRVYSSGKALWIPDIRSEANLNPAWQIENLGLKSAYGFPLLIGNDVVGVMEFFSELEKGPDEKLLEIMAHLGAQLGRVVEWQRTQAELQRSEVYFRKLTENALDLITILNVDGTIRYESRSIQQVLGFTPEEYTGKNAFSFVHPDDLPMVSQSFAEALKRQGNTEILVFRFRHRDGTYRILEGMGLNLLADPDVEGIVFNSRDVTERKRLEEQFLQAQKVQAIGQLAAGVAHDFNNILTAILGYSDMALMRLTPEDQLYGHMTGVKQAAFRAAALTRQLLAFGRKQMLQPRVLNLNTSISEMEKMLRRILGADITLICNHFANLGRVRTDPSQIEQVILNLAVNARDAMPKGGRLTIETANVVLDEEYARLRKEVTPGDYVMLAVSDNGSGMTSEVKNRLFEPFFTTKELGKGTGLGLATCHGIIKQSGGHIAVYSELGEGTTFKVYLPLVDGPEEEVETTNVRTAPAPRGNQTALLVEDEPMLRELTVTYLTSLGYEVLSAGNGRQALNLLHASGNKKIDILISDVIMPEMGGKDLAQFVQGMSPKTKVLFCSGYTEDAVNLRGTMGNGTAFIPKPYTIDALALKVRELLDQ